MPHSLTHGLDILALLFVSALLLGGCDKSEAEEGSSDDDRGFECAAHAEQLGGFSLAPLQVTPASERDGECYRQMTASLGSSGSWNGIFAGPFGSEDEWTAFLNGKRAAPNALVLAIGGLEADGTFELVPPTTTNALATMPEPGQAMLTLATDTEVRQGELTLEMPLSLAAVDGTVVVSGFREVEYGPPAMTATIEATVNTWKDGEPVGEPIELRTTLEFLD